MKSNLLLLLLASSASALVMRADPALPAEMKADTKAAAPTRPNNTFEVIVPSSVNAVDKTRPEPPYIVDANRKLPHDPRYPEPKRVYNPITEQKVEQLQKIRIQNAFVRAQAQSKVAGELAAALKAKE